MSLKINVDRGRYEKFSLTELETRINAGELAVPLWEQLEFDSNSEYDSLSRRLVTQSGSAPTVPRLGPGRDDSDSDSSVGSQPGSPPDSKHCPPASRASSQ